MNDEPKFEIGDLIRVKNSRMIEFIHRHIKPGDDGVVTDVFDGNEHCGCSEPDCADCTHCYEIEVNGHFYELAEDEIEARSNGGLMNGWI